MLLLIWHSGGLAKLAGKASTWEHFSLQEKMYSFDRKYHEVTH